MKHRNTYNYGTIATFVKLSFMSMSVTRRIKRHGSISISIGVECPLCHVRCWVDLIININALDDELNGIKHVEN